LSFLSTKGIDKDKSDYWRRGTYQMDASRKGLIPPNDFIYIAEYSGLIKQIGNWVIEEACRQVQEWKSKGLPEIAVSINVSAIQFQDRDLKNR